MTWWRKFKGDINKPIVFVDKAFVKNVHDLREIYLGHFRNLWLMMRSVLCASELVDKESISEVFV